MLIGLTYDLKKVYLAAGYSEEEAAEFDSEETIDAIADAVKALGHVPVRIGNLSALVKLLACHQRWDMVFNIAEGMHGRNRESQIPALLEGYRIPYTFSDPLTLSMSLDKGVAKRVVDQAGVPTPRFITIDSPAELNLQAATHGLQYPLFVKPVNEGTGKGVTRQSLVHTDEELRVEAVRQLGKHRQPVLVEEYLPGREYTVGIMGTGKDARVLGVMEICFKSEGNEGFYSYSNKKDYLERVEYRLTEDRDVVAEASDVALGAYRALECRDVGRVDLRADASGRLQFMEVNPLPGLNPVDSDLPILCGKLHMTYQDLIAGILKSARARIPIPPNKPQLMCA